jgi:hypothetical protein
VPLDCLVSQRSNGSLRQWSTLQSATICNSAAIESEAQKLEGTELSGWHRTVRCATRLSSEPSEQRLLAPMVDSAKCYNMQQCRDRVRSAEVRGHRTVRVAPDCPLHQDDRWLQRSTAQNPNGCADVARTGQCTVAVRWSTGLSSVPIASSLCQRLQSGWRL